MFAKGFSSTVVGLEGVLVEVETDILSVLPAFTLVELPDKTVEESKERVRSALKNTGAELPKEGLSFDVAKLTQKNTESELSKEVRKRMVKARLRQQKRFQKKKIITNSEMSSRMVKETQLEENVQDILREAMIKLSLSARSYHKLIKVARTIADPEGRDIVKENHVFEALQYRPASRESYE